MAKMAPNKKIIVVLPAYNASKTLQRTLDAIPKDWIDDIILIDDASQDNTVETAKNLGLKVFQHSSNMGYGANQKTCYQEALKLNCDIAIMVHPDFQYDPTYIPELLKPIIYNDADAVFGSRMKIKGWAMQGGMPHWKYVANIFLTKIENLALGLNLSEYHSGFRAYSKMVLQKIPLQLNSNDFVFDTEIIIQLRLHNFRIKEIPIKTRYFKEASMIGFWRSLKYGLAILFNLIQYKLSQWKIRVDRRFIILK